MTTFPYVKSSVKKYSVARNSFLPRYVTVPLDLEPGVQYKLVVEPGNFVNEGQVIAIPKGNNDCKIHSPLPGEVIDIFTDVSASGRPELMVKIAFSGSFSYTGKNKKEQDWKFLSQETICSKLNDFGVINTFFITRPVSLTKTIEKGLSKKAETLIVRLFDEDPVRLTDSFLSLKYFNEIRKGSEIIAQAAKISNIVFFMDNSLASNTFELDPNEKLIFTNSKKYPSGFKKELCNAWNKSSSKNAGFNISENDIFIDSTTAYETYKAIAFDMPGVDHLVQFTGNCIPVNCILNVRLGTTLDDIVAQIGGFNKTPNFIVVNGHVTGNSVSWRNFPITKYVKSISFVSQGQTPEQLVCNCISCGNCRSICPRNLAPDLLFKHITEQYPLPKEYLKKIDLCEECGLCNSVCPSRIALTQIISAMKKMDK
ncbi:MAG: 4Fe-4S dicluster domain-containing protein [Treponema sp.]|nr:4Fe-4S dicluster domain-containing protein [Treponema sp.]